jgi:hypothetical protein
MTGSDVWFWALEKASMSYQQLLNSRKVNDFYYKIFKRATAYTDSNEGWKNKFLYNAIDQPIQQKEITRLTLKIG